MSKPSISIVSELYKAGTTEDGEDYIAERYMIQAEFSDGSRFHYNHSFPGAKYYSDEDTFGWEDIRPEAMAIAEKHRVYMTSRIAAGETLDLDKHWSETYPAYGSGAFIKAEASGLYKNDPIYN